MNNEIFIIAEQEGEIERLFKSKLINMFHESGKRIRAYLALVQYGMVEDMHVALLIHSDIGEDKLILQQCQQIFIDMFSNTEHLDIIFISTEFEKNVRKVCCPFYTSLDFNVTTPDFYLYSNDGYHLDDVMRNCYMRARLYADRPDGYMLCDIDPPLNGINQLIIGNKLQGMTLFPVSEWPFPIYVLRPLIDNIALQDFIDPSNSELIAWAQIYDRKQLE